MEWIWLNNEWFPAAEARIPVLDRGLMLGDGLFETLRARRCEPDFFAEHYQRLSVSARSIHIPFPWSQLELHSVIRELCARNALDDATVRLTLTRGPYKGSLSLDAMASPTLVIACFGVGHARPELYQIGVDLLVSSLRKSSGGSDGGIKATSYLPNILAKHEADKAGAYEAILCGASNRGEAILECSTASFFAVIEGVLRTHPTDGSILPGITRAKVLQLCKQLSIPLREEVVPLAQVANMSEAFITSSVRGVMPVRKVGNTGLAVPGPITKRLRIAYEDLLGN